jgi:hypothetical protein
LGHAYWRAKSHPSSARAQLSRASGICVTASATPLSSIRSLFRILC